MAVNVPNIRQPEYTGENRCLPCTTVNVLIAAVVSGLVGIWSVPFGITSFGIALGLIYLRGYLVPGTPSLTKRYLPAAVLRWFGTEPSLMSNNESTNIDPERVLMDAGAVSACENGVDLCLTPRFQTAWRDRIQNLDQGVGEEDLRKALGISSEKGSFEKYGDATIARYDKGIIGQWPSLAAKVADLAAVVELTQRYPQWERLNFLEKARVLTSLRVFIEECPDCGGTVHLGQEAVDSCCQSYDVAISVCEECDATLFEMEWQDEFASAEDSKSRGGSLTA